MTKSLYQHLIEAGIIDPYSQSSVHPEIGTNVSGRTSRQRRYKDDEGRPKLPRGMSYVSDKEIRNNLRDEKYKIIIDSFKDALLRMMNSFAVAKNVPMEDNPIGNLPPIANIRQIIDKFDPEFEPINPKEFAETAKYIADQWEKEISGEWFSGRFPLYRALSLVKDLFRMMEQCIRSLRYYASNYPLNEFNSLQQKIIAFIRIFFYPHPLLK
jgi:hypothetical protein